MISLDQKFIEQFFFDPVMAARVLMGAKLDVFQACRLRTYWFVPWVIDSSGVGTGKSEIQFIYANLRCILFPNHIAAVYFPNFQTGKDVFWPKFEAYEEKSATFCAQFPSGARKQDEAKANLRNPGAWIRSYKNGSKLFILPGDFKGDSKNQASRDFNTIVVDEWLRCEDMGDGLDRQIIDRARRASYNQRHPIWANHVKLLGHAGSMQDKGYRRFKGFRQKIRDGSSAHALISFCFRDYSKPYQKYLNTSLKETQQASMSRDAFRRQWLGIWAVDGENYYPMAIVMLARRCSIVPMTKRIHPKEVFVLGKDVAPPGSVHADFCAWVVLRIVELFAHQDRATLEKDGRFYHLSFVFAHMLRNRRASQLAAITHQLHLNFGFSVITLDPGGGGLWVLPELRESKQLLHGIEKRVTPLTTRNDPLQMMRQPIVSLFKRGGDFDGLIEQGYRTGDEGFIERSHMLFRDAWYGRQFLYPARVQDRAREQMQGWSRERMFAQHFLDMTAKQVAAVRQLRRPDGTKLVSGRGFGLFEAKGKKDLAYAALYAFMGGLLWMQDQDFRSAANAGGCFAVSGDREE